MINKEKIRILVLAAGLGKRMRSDLPKALAQVRGKPMIGYVLEAIHKSGVDDRPIIVVGHKKKKIMERLGEKYDYVVQEKQEGTGHAVMSAQKFMQDKAEHVLILPSDHPYVNEKTIKDLARRHLASKTKITMATIYLSDFKDWRVFFYNNFSRIVRDKNGEILRDVQVKDLKEEEKNITEVNPIYLCFEAKWLWKKIKDLKTDNAQKEYYLTDLIRVAILEGEKIESFDIDPREGLGANSKEELETLEKFEV